MRRTFWANSACTSRPRANEAAAAAMLAASVMYPIRGAVTWKSTVGTNVASDALSNLASGGVHRRRADHHRRGLRRRLLDHAGAQPRLRDEIADLAARSRAPTSNPSSRRSRTASSCRRRPTRRSCCEVRIRCLPRPRPLRRQGQQAPAVHGGRGAGKSAPRHQPHRAAAGLLSCTRRKRSSSAGRPRSISSGSASSTSSSAGDVDEVGIIMQGGMYNGVIRALQRLGLADVWGNTRMSALCAERRPIRWSTTRSSNSAKASARC